MGFGSSASVRKARKHRESKVLDDPSIQGRSDFCGERLQNTAQTIDHRPDASQATKGVGKEVKLCYTESVLMESRIGVIFDLRLVRPPGGPNPSPRPELRHVVRGPCRIAVAGEKGFHTMEFVAVCHALDVPSQIVQKRRSLLNIWSLSYETDSRFELSSALW